MAQGIISYNTAWGIGTETTFGTAVVPAAFIPFQQESLNKEREALELTTTQTRQQQEFIGDTSKHLGRITVGGDVTFNVEPINVGFVLKHAVGAPAAPTETAVGSGIWDHTFKVDDTLKPFTTQVKLSDTKAKRVQGCMIDSLSLDFAEDMLTASASLKAQDLQIISSPATPCYPTQRPFVFTDAKFELGGTPTDVTGQVTNANLTLSNNVVDDDYRQGSALLQGLYAGTLSVEGTMEVVYDPAATGDFAVWADNDLTGGTPTAKDLTITYTGNALGASKYTLTVKIPRALVTASSPQVSAGEKVTRTVAFRGFYDVTAADPDKGISFKLRNNRTTAY